MATYAYIREGFPFETRKQLEILLTHKLDNIFIDELDFKKQKEWKRLLLKMNKDDEIIIVSLTVFGKNITELLPILNIFLKRKIHLISLDEQLDTKSQPDFFKVCGTLVQFEQTILLHQKENRNKCRENSPSGKTVIGRPKIDSEKVEKIEYLFKNKGLSLRDIARECDVSLGAVHKYVKRFREEELSSLRREV